MWGRPRGELTAIFVAALACSGRNPAYRPAVVVVDGAAALDNGGDQATIDAGSDGLEAQLPPDAFMADGLEADAAALDTSDAVPVDTEVPVDMTAPVDMAPEVARDAPPADLAVNPMDAPMDSPIPNGTGLLGNYFDGTQLENGTPGTLDMQRVDDLINFDWPRDVSPDPRIDDDYFSVRWLGQVMPLLSGTYTFTTITDDGVKLWVGTGAVPLLDAWTATGATTNSGSLTLNAYQKYSIRMEYRETTQAAGARLYWTPPGQSMQLVPKVCLFPATP